MCVKWVKSRLLNFCFDVVRDKTKQVKIFFYVLNIAISIAFLTTGILLIVLPDERNTVKEAGEHHFHYTRHC